MLREEERGDLHMTNINMPAEGLLLRDALLYALTTSTTTTAPSTTTSATTRPPPSLPPLTSQYVLQRERDYNSISASLDYHSLEGQLCRITEWFQSSVDSPRGRWVYFCLQNISLIHKFRVSLFSAWKRINKVLISAKWPQMTSTNVYGAVSQDLGITCVPNVAL